MSKGNTSFGIGGIALFSAAGLAGFSEITGAFTADLNFPLIDVMGGPYRLPVDAMQGRGEGGFTLTLNDRPDWVDVVANSAILSTLTGAEAYSLNNIEGTPDFVVADKAANSKARRGVYYIRVIAVDSVEVTLTSDAGVVTHQVAAVGTQAKDIGETGLTIAKSADKAWIVGDRASLLVLGYSAARPGKRLEYQSRGVAVPEYNLLVFTSISGVSSGNIIRVLDLPRVKFAGTPFGITDQETNSGVELSGKILIPDGGGAYGIQYQLLVEG